MSEPTVAGAATATGGGGGGAVPNGAAAMPYPAPAPSSLQPATPAPAAVPELPEDLEAQAILAKWDAEDAAAAAAAGQEGGTEPQGDAAAQLAHWKKMARQNEARAKANAEKAQQFDAYQQSQMTELQKAEARATAAEEAVKEANAERFRLTALTTNNLDHQFADLLGSGTQAEINERAQSIASIVNNLVEQRVNEALSRNGNNGQPQRQPGGRPIESMRPGSAPSSQNSAPQNPDQVFRGLLGR